MFNIGQRTHIVWKSSFYLSIENCIINRKEEGYEISSNIIANNGNKIDQVDYTIQANRSWEVGYMSVNARINDLIHSTILEKINDKWFLNNKVEPAFQNFAFIDISLTPSTNMLPVNGLQLKQNERQVIDVIYFDILKNETNPSKQVYTRLSNDVFLYENYDGSFKAEIKVDEEGFVTYYPGIFKMRSKQIV